MEVRQQKVMDSFVRVRRFLDEHPSTGVLTYADARETLDDVLHRVRGLATAQYRGRELGRAEARRAAEQMQVIVDQHMRPIVAIARAQIEPGSDVGLPTALRMPKLGTGPSRLVAFCDGMIEAARAHEAVFVAKGLPADFLARFEAARDTLEQLAGGRATHVSSRVAARSGLRVHLLRGRRAVERLDSVVRATFRGDAATLAAWRLAKRVTLTPSVMAGAGERDVSVDEQQAAADRQVA